MALSRCRSLLRSILDRDPLCKRTRIIAVNLLRDPILNDCKVACNPVVRLIWMCAVVFFTAVAIQFAHAGSFRATSLVVTVVVPEFSCL